MTNARHDPPVCADRIYDVSLDSSTVADDADDALRVFCAQLATGNVCVDVSPNPNGTARDGLDYADLAEATAQADAVVDAALGLLGLFLPRLATTHQRLAARARLHALAGSLSTEPADDGL